MKNAFIYFLLYCLTCLLPACSKKDPINNTALNVENLSGTYALKALIWVGDGTSVDVYSQLDDCEKDNLTKLNTDKTFNLIDVGTVCTPPENDNGIWDIRGDSMYISNSNPGKIQSFDGKTLILTGIPDDEPDVIATTTLVKQ